MNTLLRKIFFLAAFVCMSSVSAQSSTIAEMVGAMKAGDYGTARSIALTYEKKTTP